MPNSCQESPHVVFKADALLDHTLCDPFALLLLILISLVAVQPRSQTDKLRGLLSSSLVFHHPITFLFFEECIWWSFG